MKIIRPKTEIDNQIYSPDYSPRPRSANFAIPTSDILASPLLCFSVNEQWVGHIIGVLSALDQPDAWVGNADEIEDARQQVRKLIGSIGECILIEDCGDVADCIESGSGGITEAMTNAQAGVGSIVAQNVAGGTSATGSNCTNDIIWGGVSELVNYLITKANDALEIIEVATNFLDLLAEWGSAFPLISTITAPIVGYLSWLQETIAENFSAQVTTEYIDSVRCDLFCLWLEKCPDGMTWNDIAIYFGERLGGWEELPNDIIDFLTFMTLGVWDGDDIADVMLFGMVGMQVLDSRAIPFINIPGLYTLDTVFALGANNPDNDWSILCDECAEPQTYTYCWFIDGNTPAWVGVAQNASRPAPIYNATDGRWEAQPSTITGTGLYGWIDFDLGAIYDDVVIEVNQQKKGSRVSSGASLNVVLDGVSKGTDGTQANTSVQNNTITTSPSAGRNIRISFNATSNNTSQVYPVAYSFITYIKISLSSVINPFPTSNCP